MSLVQIRPPEKISSPELDKGGKKKGKVNGLLFHFELTASNILNAFRLYYWSQIKKTEEVTDNLGLADFTLDFWASTTYHSPHLRMARQDAMHLISTPYHFNGR